MRINHHVVDVATWGSVGVGVALVAASFCGDQMAPGLWRVLCCVGSFLVFLPFVIVNLIIALSAAIGIAGEALKVLAWLASIVERIARAGAAGIDRVAARLPQ